MSHRRVGAAVMMRRRRPYPAYKARRKRAAARAAVPMATMVAMAAIRGVRAAQRGECTFDRESDSLYARAAAALLRGN